MLWDSLDVVNHIDNKDLVRVVKSDFYPILMMQLCIYLNYATHLVDHKCMAYWVMNTYIDDDGSCCKI